MSHQSENDRISALETKMFRLSTVEPRIAALEADVARLKEEMGTANSDVQTQTQAIDDAMIAHGTSGLHKTGSDV